MSKRFGRNQKRKLKTEVVGLKNQVSGLTKDKDWYYKNTSQYKQALDDIRGYLGKYFSGLPPQELSVLEDHICFDSFRIAAHSFHKAYHEDPLALADSICQILHLDVASVELFKDKIRGSVHVTLRTNKGDLRYAFAEEVIVGMDQEVLERHLSRVFSQELKKLYNKGTK